jgi:hypothetical protein
MSRAAQSATARSKRAPARGKNCSSACLTKDHESFGECLRAKNLHLNPNLADTNAQKSWDKELDNYESARRQGVEPAGTKQHQIDAAMREAEHGSN